MFSIQDKKIFRFWLCVSFRTVLSFLLICYLFVVIKTVKLRNCCEKNCATTDWFEETKSVCLLFFHSLWMTTKKNLTSADAIYTQHVRQAMMWYRDRITECSDCVCVFFRVGKFVGKSRITRWLNPQCNGCHHLSPLHCRLKLFNGCFFSPLFLSDNSNCFSCSIKKRTDAFTLCHELFEAVCFFSDCFYSHYIALFIPLPIEIH